MLLAKAFSMLMVGRGVVVEGLDAVSYIQARAQKRLSPWRGCVERKERTLAKNQVLQDRHSWCLERVSFGETKRELSSFFPVQLSKKPTLGARRGQIYVRSTAKGPSLPPSELHKPGDGCVA